MEPLEKRLSKALRKRNIEAIKECCSEAFHLYEKLLYYVANQVLKDTELSKDAVSEAFLSFMSHLDSIELKSIKYYLVQSTQRIAKRMLYEGNQTIEYDDDIQGRKGGEGSAGLDAETALSALEEDEREIVIYKIEYGYKFKEIGEMLGISENAASSKYTRSLKKMKEKLEERP